MDLKHNTTVVIALAIAVTVVMGVMTPVIADALNNGGSGGDSQSGYVNEGISYLKSVSDEEYSIKITNNENNVTIEKDNEPFMTLNKGDEYWKIPLLMDLTDNTERWYLMLEYAVYPNSISEDEGVLYASSVTVGSNPEESYYENALDEFDVGGYCTLDITHNSDVVVAQYGSDDSELYSGSYNATHCISDEGEYVYADKPTVSADTVIPVILPDYIIKRGQLHIGPHEDQSEGVERQAQNHSYPSYADAYFIELDDPNATYTLTITGTTYENVAINGASCQAIASLGGAIIGPTWRVTIGAGNNDAYFTYGGQHWKKAVIVGTDVTLYNTDESVSTQISGAKYCFWPDGDLVDTYGNPKANDTTEIFARGQFAKYGYGSIYVEGSLENNTVYTTSGPDGVNITNQGQGQFIYNPWDHTSIWKIEATVDGHPVTLSFSSSVSGATVLNMFCIAPKDVTVLYIDSNTEKYPPDDTDVVLNYGFNILGIGTADEWNQNTDSSQDIMIASPSLEWISSDDDGYLKFMDLQYTFNTTETSNGIRLDGITIESVWGSDESLTETDTFTKFIVPTVVGSEGSIDSNVGWIAAGGDSVIMAWGYADGRIGLYHPGEDDFYVQDMNTNPILPIAIGDKWFIFIDYAPNTDAAPNMKITGDISSTGLSVDYITTQPYISIISEITISGTTISFVKDLSTYELDGLVAYINDSGPMKCLYNENAKTTGTVYTGSLINYLNLSQQEQFGYSLCTVTSGTVSTPTVTYSNGYYGHNSTLYPNVVGDVTAQFTKNGSTITGLKLSGTYGNGNGTESFEYPLNLTGQTAPDEEGNTYKNESFLFVIGTPDESSGGGSGGSMPASLTAIVSAVPIIVLAGLVFVGIKMFRMQ